MSDEEEVEAGQGGRWHGLVRRVRTTSVRCSVTMWRYDLIRSMNAPQYKRTHDRIRGIEYLK
jgi:hypothetical protein